MPERPVVIIGGGISGLATAYLLTKHGIRPTLLEKAERVGGLIATEQIEGCDLEAGPDSFIAAKTSVAELARELGIEDQIIGSNDEQRRIFIAKRGVLKQMPPGMVMMAPADLAAALRSDFFSPAAKLRFVRELFYIAHDRQEDVSLQDFITDHFGSEVLENVTEPLLSGVYGGDAARLSTRSVLPRFLDYERRCGSLIRAVRRERTSSAKQGSLFLSFAGGMQSIVDALSTALAPSADLITGEAVGIERSGSGWRVHTHGQSIETRQLVLACPAHVAAGLLRQSVSALAEELGAIPFSSAILVTFVYDRTRLGHPLDGFGFLVPRRERQTLAAATWTSTKFPLRTPPGRAAIRAFIVGTEADSLMQDADSSVVSLARADIHHFMGVTSQALSTLVGRWPESMPQYVVGHEKRVGTIRELLAECKGLHLCGNAYDGVGIPDCVRLARQTALKVAQSQCE